MSFCRSCGSEVPGDMSFCTSCGAPTAIVEGQQHPGEATLHPQPGGFSPQPAAAGPQPGYPVPPASLYAGGYQGQRPMRGPAKPAVIVLGVFTLILLLAQTYFYRYIKDDFDFVKHWGYGYHRSSRALVILLSDLLTAIGPVAAIIGLVRASRGGRTWWLITLIVAVALPVLDLVLIRLDVPSGFGPAWSELLKDVFGFGSTTPGYVQAILLGRTAAIVTAILAVASSGNLKEPAPTVRW